MNVLEGKAIVQNLPIDLPYRLDVLRLDLLDPEISGNKWFKLKRNLQRAEELGYRSLLTFGGAHSNHIAATAAACKRKGINCIAVIRGEKPAILNPTLIRASELGMQLHFVNRQTYKDKNEAGFLRELKDRFGEFYLIPEGGNNREGFLGCTEILGSELKHDYIFCACGTGTTYAGLVAAARSGQCVIGISVLKGQNTLVNDVNTVLGQTGADSPLNVAGNEGIAEGPVVRHVLTNAYSFKGYASLEEEWLVHKKQFEKNYQVLLDYIYTSKMTYAVFDLMRSGKLKKGASILMVHSGGLQGNQAFEERYHLMPSL